jgi:coenzyme Q-binding protein COQ10
MSKYTEQRVLPYAAEQLFDLVADVEKYPQFLPWCVAARIRERKGNEISADLAIGFKMYRERFTSRVILDRPRTIHVTYSDGPFRYLENEWRFEPLAGGQCRIHFYVDFEFKSRILQKVIEVLFNEAVRRMVAAFEERARKLYGPVIASSAPVSTAGGVSV